MFLETLQSSPENTCVRVSFLIKLQAFSYRTRLVAASLPNLFFGWQKTKQRNNFQSWREKKHLKLSFENVQNHTPRRRPPLIVPSLIKSNQVDFAKIIFEYWFVFLSRFHIVLGSINSLKINFIFAFGERDEKNRMNNRIKKLSRHFLISFKDDEPGSHLLNDRIKKLSRHFLISFKDAEPGSHLLLSYNKCVKEVAWKDFLFFWANHLTSEPKSIFRKCTHIDFSILLL